MQNVMVEMLVYRHDDHMLTTSIDGILEMYVFLVELNIYLTTFCDVSSSVLNPISSTYDEGEHYCAIVLGFKVTMFKQ